MRLCYFLLAAGVGLLACSEASTIEPDNVVSARNSDSSRLLRTANVGPTKNDEERGTFQGILLDNMSTKKALKYLLGKKISVEKVKEKYLGMPSTLTSAQLLEHTNWGTLVKYQRMKLKQIYGNTLPYAHFDSRVQTKEETEKKLLTFILEDASVEKVGTYMGVWKLPKNELVVHRNYRAFKKYSTMLADYKNAMKSLKYASFGTGIQNAEKTKEMLSKWAMAGTPIADVEKSLKLTGLSGIQLRNNVNYEALQVYKWNYKLFKVLKGLN